MKPRTSIILAVIGVLVFGTALLVGPPQGAPRRPAAVAPGALVFPGLAPKLQQAARVEITSKGQTLAIGRTDDRWGLADRGNYPVQQDKLRELLTGLTELRLAEPRTAEPPLYERLGVGDPAAPTSTANLVRVLDGSGQVIAELIVGHRRVRAQGNAPETIYIRRPGEAQSWLAEGRLPVDADPQLWLDRDIANIPASRIASVVVHRGDQTLEFGRDGDKPVLKAPADHPKLDDYKVEDVFRALETLTLSDVKPVAQEPGERVGSATLTTTDGAAIDATVFRADKDIWLQLAVRGDSAEAKALAARAAGWTFQVGSWKEKAFVPTLADLKAAEPEKPAPAAPAAPPEAAVPEAAPAAPVPAPGEAGPPAGSAPPAAVAAPGGGAAGTPPAEGKPADATPSGDEPGGEKPTGDQHGSEQPGGDQPGGAKTPNDSDTPKPAPP